MAQGAALSIVEMRSTARVRKMGLFLCRYQAVIGPAGVAFDLT